ncbi:MAG: glycosyltransferase family 39 protein [Flavobacteriales bacterium]|nr:glycosyltransferase family 39 protein [Flavobacteriales bacterium]
MLTPTLQNEPYYNKPPLFNWVQAFFIRLFQSESERVLRFPSMLFFLTGFLVYRKTLKASNRDQALAAALLLLVSADILFYGSINSGEIDLFYSFLVLAQWFSFHTYWQSGSHWKMFLWSSLFCALGFLTKGPPSVVFQVLTVGFWLWRKKQWKLIFSVQHFVGILLFLSIVVAYFRAYDWKNGHADGYILNLFLESGQKAGTDRSIWTRMEGMLTYLPNLLLIALPGSALILLPATRRFRKRLPPLDPFTEFCLFTLLINIPVYMLSGRFVARYNYMFLPLIAILAAWIYQHSIHIKGEQHNSTLGKLIMAIGSILLGLLTILTLTGSIQVEPLWIGVGTLFTFAVSLWQRRRHLSPIVNITILLFTVRIVYNLSILPTIAERTDYPGLCRSWVAQANGASIYLTGSGESQVLRLSNSFIDTLHIPPRIPYQIPYYLMRLQNIAMEYHDYPKSGEVYLSPELPEHNFELLNTYYDHWQQRNLYLFRKG